MRRRDGLACRSGGDDRDSGAGDGGDRRRCGGDLRDRGRAGERRLDRREQRAEVPERGEAAPSRRRALVEQLGEGAAATEDQRLGVRERDVEPLRDLGVGEPAPVAQQHRPALQLRQARKRVLEADQLVTATLARGGPLEIDGIADELEPPAPSHRLAAREADVARDPEQPGELDGGDDAAAEPTDGVEERRLDGVLGVLAAPELREAVGEDLGRVDLEERAGEPCVGRERQRLEACGTTGGADCGQASSSTSGGDEGAPSDKSIPAAAVSCTPSIGGFAPGCKFSAARRTSLQPPFQTKGHAAMPMIELLICDDSDEARSALRTMLADHDEIVLVGEAVNGDDAVERALELRPDVVLMDLHMPIVDGVDATRRIAKLLPSTRVVAYSAADDSGSVSAMTEAGAAAYCVKGAPLWELERAIAGRSEPLVRLAHALVRASNRTSIGTIVARELLELTGAGAAAAYLASADVALSLAGSAGSRTGAPAGLGARPRVARVLDPPRGARGSGRPARARPARPPLLGCACRAARLGRDRARLAAGDDAARLGPRAGRGVRLRHRGAGRIRLRLRAQARAHPRGGEARRPHRAREPPRARRAAGGGVARSRRGRVGARGRPLRSRRLQAVQRPRRPCHR